MLMKFELLISGGERVNQADGVVTLNSCLQGRREC